MNCFARQVRLDFVLLFVIFNISSGIVFAGYKSVQVYWLGGDAPQTRTAVSFGVPWEKGGLKQDTEISMTDSGGEIIPADSWDMAYWQDGSVKWTGISCVIDGNSQPPFSVSAGSPEDGSKLRVEESYDNIIINTAGVSYQINKKGNRLIEKAVKNGRVIAEHLRLIAYLKDSPNPNEEYVTTNKYHSKFRQVTLESSNRVRAVVKAKGIMHCETNGRELFPFVIRLYFYTGMDTVKTVFSFEYTADHKRDFVSGLGMKIDVPLRKGVLNRHVIFAGDKDSNWHEAVRLMTGRGSSFRSFGDGIFEKQMACKEIPAMDNYNDSQKELIRNLPEWNDYKLVQNSSGQFTIYKRANKKSCWIKSGYGERCRGTAFAGDTSGGVTVGLRDFRQSCPSGIEINNTAAGTAQMTMWIWPPDAKAMDMRHYDTESHSLAAVYEDYEFGHSTPYGIARTSVVTFGFEDKAPSLDKFNRFANTVSDPPLLVCKPEYYHSVPVFGVWSLPDRTSESKRWIENKLDTALDYYLNEVDRRDWYGFWNYGDVMHSYDTVRHKWKYDIGGYAWANTELAPNVWLWYSFLRTGRKDIFRMAEAMTRHTQEVDTYHRGEMKGLGTRHNVRHWGGGAKEARVSHAGYHRFYYYLTADERTGDVMEEVINADYSTVNVPPLRKIVDDKFRKHNLDPADYNYPTYVRSGPDWVSFVANWMTAWERTGNDKYLRWISRGMNDIADSPYGLFTSYMYGYNPETKHLYPIPEDPEFATANHLMMIMGGFEVMSELNQLIDNPEWEKVWLDFCERYNWSSAKWEQEEGIFYDGGNFSGWYARVTAYAADKMQDPELAERAWREFLNQPYPGKPLKVNDLSVLNKTVEIPGASTNHYSQWSLNAIELLELVGDYIPEDIPE